MFFRSKWEKMARRNETTLAHIYTKRPDRVFRDFCSHKNHGNQEKNSTLLIRIFLRKTFGRVVKESRARMSLPFSLSGFCQLNKL